MNDQDDSSDSSEAMELSDHLKPTDQLLRSLANAPLPEPPDGLCHRTLERCFACVDTGGAEMKSPR